MTIVSEPREEIAKWVMQRIPYVIGYPDGYTALALMDGEKITAAAIYYNYTGFDIEFDCATDGPIGAAFGAVFQYPFDQLGCQRISARVATKNLRSISLLERTGFKREGVKRQALDGDDLYMYGLLKSERPDKRAAA